MRETNQAVLMAQNIDQKPSALVKKEASISSSTNPQDLFFPNYWTLNLVIPRVDDLMESKGGKKSSSKSLFYEAPLGYSVEDIRPNGGIEKFQSAEYSNRARRPS
ncbi:unnamed protein product [Fraxinus pennsylvanica]|uniref:Uncharacterized protein n=1 Tax=Fraxinus pennsylvanica TaxID=56036 RepID=A0AAD2DS93_9LAMI|nr:unnamed protein product [Fraxinus pennsylvanica]